MREEENKRSSQNSSFKRFFQKRWVFPAVYIASAAIILTGLLWYQSSGSVDEKSKMYDYNATDVPGKGFNQPSLEVNRSLENFKMPVTSQDAVVQKQFYDFEGKKEQQEAALVFYNNTYHPNTGIDIALKSGETFDVVAAMSGTVTKVEEDSLLGNVIEIEHDKGIVTQYQSVKDVKVEVGDEVKQGQALAKAGQSLFNEKAGVHVHFEIRKDNVAVNPIDYFEKSLSALQEAKVPAAGKKQESSEEAADKEEAGQTEDGDAGKSEDDSKSEDGSADDKKESADDENSSEKEEPSDESSDSLDNENS